MPTPNQEGIQIEAGNLLPTSQGFVVANRVNEADNTIIFALTLLNPAPPATGSGPLARVTFNVLNANPFTINIAKAKLVSVDLQTIPSQTTPLVIGNGEQQNAQLQGAPQQNVEQLGSDQQSAIQQQSAILAPLPADTSAEATDASDFPWWIVAVGIMVLGILGLGALIIMSGLNKSSQQTNNQQHQFKQQRQTPAQTTPRRIDQQPSKRVPGRRPSAFS